MQASPPKSHFATRSYQQMVDLSEISIVSSRVSGSTDILLTMIIVIDFNIKGNEEGTQEEYEHAEPPAYHQNSS